MAAVGSFLCNQGTVDQDVPEPQLLVSFDDADVSIPTWTDLTSRMRAYDSQRGRGSELEDHDAGTCSVVLDNRDRALDPTNAASAYYPNVRPMNKVWLRVHWAGAIHDVFTGWSESAPQTYPSFVDALVTLKASDEFRPLALDALPTTNPPRDTYVDLVKHDDPVAYWRMSSDLTSTSQVAEVGPELSGDLVGGAVSLAAGAIIGDAQYPAAALGLDDDSYLFSPLVEENEPFDLGGGTDFTFETWFKAADATPAGGAAILNGIASTTGYQFTMGVTSGGLVTVTARNSSPANVTVTASTALADDRWYHLVTTLTGGTLTLYIDGTQAGTAAFAGTVEAGNFSGAGNRLVVGAPAGSGTTFYYDETAVYRTALSATRITAHYTAGRSRGFAREQPGHERIIAVLDTIGSNAPRSIRSAQRNMTGAYMRGQSPLEELRDVVHAEAVDAQLFVAADGTITFLDAEHRGFTPWSASQATFGDSGAELPYQDITVDFSDSFLVNEWNVTAEGGLTQTARDTASIAAYLKRPQSISGLKITNGDSVAQDIADDLLAKTKDPMVRITGVQPQMADGPAATAALSAELGDKLRIKRRPPGGGSAIDQQSWVQQISVSGTPDDVYPVVKLGVSPV